MPTVAVHLTYRQRQLCQVIEQLTRERGYPPSMAEAAAAMQLHVSRISQLARSTEEKGAISRTPGCSRSWRVVPPVMPSPLNPTTRHTGGSRR